MDAMPEIDRISYPGGHDAVEIVVAVKLSAQVHFGNLPMGETARLIVERFLLELVARHPGGLPMADPYQVRVSELSRERRSLLQSPLSLSWFRLAYWSHGLIAVRSGASPAQVADDVYVKPMQVSLRELGIEASAEQCLAEVERFRPLVAEPRGVEAGAFALLSFLRFLHRAALRRRRFVTPELALPSVGLAHDPADAAEAGRMSQYLSAHGIASIDAPPAAPAGARLLVLLSREAIASPDFWHAVQAWKARPVIPMVVCTMPKAELYREAPSGVAVELWDWLGDNVAVDLGADIDTRNQRYLMLLRALDSPDPRQWWWRRGDAIDIGFAVDVLGLVLPRPREPTPAPAQGEPAAAYPNPLDGTLLVAAQMASEHFARRGPSGDHPRYYLVCKQLIGLREQAPSEPHGLPWFMLIYRAWLAFASLRGSSDALEDAAHAERELQQALFALGIGSAPGEVPAFLQSFAALPWAVPADSIEAVDERLAALLALVSQLSNGALARGQRMRLQHPAATCFISYARPDEALARELVEYLEAKGADVWWDLNAITLGAPLDDALRAAVQGASCLFLIATPASARSDYVRLEVETAARQGLRIVPIVGEAGWPPGFDAAAFEAPIVAIPLAMDAAKDAALALLQRTPQEQLDALRAQVSCRSLLAHLRRLRTASKV